MGIGPPSQFSLYVATSVARVLSCHFMQFLLKVSFCWPVSLGMMALVPLPPPQRVGRKKTRPSDQINRLVNFHTFPRFGFRSIQSFRRPYFFVPTFQPGLILPNFELVVSQQWQILYLCNKKVFQNFRVLKEIGPVMRMFSL